jgi:hypothetical protein
MEEIKDYNFIKVLRNSHTHDNSFRDEYLLFLDKEFIFLIEYNKGERVI